MNMGTVFVSMLWFLRMHAKRATEGDCSVGNRSRTREWNRKGIINSGGPYTAAQGWYTPNRQGGVSGSPHPRASGFFGEAFSSQGDGYSVTMAFTPPVNYNDWALKGCSFGTDTLHFGEQPWLLWSLRRLNTSVSFSRLLTFWIPLNLGKGKGRLEQSFKTLKMPLSALNLGSYWLFNNHLEVFLDSRQLV